MVFVSVFTAVNALIIVGLLASALRGKRLLPLPWAVATTVAEPTEPAWVDPHQVAAPASTSDRAGGGMPVRRLRQETCEPKASNSVELDEVRQDYWADVSHELKTPVGAVALLAEAVLCAAEDPHQVRWFGNKILHEANRLSALVSELIALSRLHGADRLPESTTVDTDEVVRAALARCQLAVESANMQITVDSPGGLLLSGDATLLTTAVSNLIDNAVAYSPPGSAVWVSTRLADGFIEIAVTDQGRGIAPEYQQRVFERFFRVDRALSRSTGGTGLGLAIVQRIAVNHGGDVQLCSKPGTGSTFTLRIPAHQHSAPGTSARASTSLLR